MAKDNPKKTNKFIRIQYRRYFGLIIHGFRKNTLMILASLTCLVIQYNSDIFLDFGRIQVLILRIVFTRIESLFMNN